MFALTLGFIFASVFSPTDQLGFDFGAQKDGADWRITNDGVMGGLSEGEASLTENSLVFAGNVSLENNGGFTSIWSPTDTYDLGEATTVTIRYRLSGKRMALDLENSRVYYETKYKLYLDKTGGEWKTLEVPIDQFFSARLGRPTNEPISRSYLKSVIRIGFITAEKKAGDFHLEVDYLKFS